MMASSEGYNKVVFTLFILGSHCFVLWTVEQTVTVVKRQQVQTTCIVVGKDKKMLFGLQTSSTKEKLQPI